MYTFHKSLLFFKLTTKSLKNHLNEPGHEGIYTIGQSGIYTLNVSIPNIVVKVFLQYLGFVGPMLYDDLSISIESYIPYLVYLYQMNLSHSNDCIGP